MHCYNCGKEIDDKAVVCVGCGVAVKPIKPQEKKLSGLQIASYILFGLQLFALIGLGAQYDLGTVFYVLGYFSLTIAGVICLVVDNSKKTKGVVSEPKEAKQKQPRQENSKEIEFVENKPIPANINKNTAVICGILSAMTFISFVILLILFFVEGAKYSDISPAVLATLGFISLPLFIVSLVSSREYKKKIEISKAEINPT